MTNPEAIAALYKYHRSLKDAEASAMTIHKGAKGETHIDYGEYVSVVSSLGGMRGTWSILARAFDHETMTVNDAEIHGETFFTVYWKDGEEVEPFQMIVYANRDERAYWRGVRICQQQPAESLVFTTAKAAFRAITERGFNKDMITYPESVRDELNRMLKNHRLLGKKTTNRVKKSAYA